MMKRLGLYVVVAAFLALYAGTVKAEMYAELYGGWSFGQTSADPFHVTPDPSWGVPPFRASYPGNIDSSFQIGLKLGTWFVPGGTLGYEYPDWMRNLGFYMDLSSHSQDFPSQEGSKTLQWSTGAKAYDFAAASSGQATTLAFMLAYRRGYMPNAEVPFGRLQPYVAMGPAILFSSQQPNATSPPTGADVKHDDFPSMSSTDIGFALEGGAQWFFKKNVSLDVSLKYRSTESSYNYVVIDDEGYTHHVTLDTNYRPVSLQAGVAYHF